MTSLCPLVHDEEAETDRGLAVCRSHARATQSAVMQLPGLHADLTYRLITTGASLTGMPHAPSKDPASASTIAWSSAAATSATS